MQTTQFKIGTRGSALALAQAHQVRALLATAHGLAEDAFSIEIFTTSGDRIQDRPLSEVGGKGLFTKELEEALLDGRIDIAVHSSKDMPTVLPDGLELGAFLKRADPRDAFIGRTSKTLAGLAQGAVVGTSSLRRQAQLRRLRPDLQILNFRGNVQTRLRKLAEGQVDATLLALAGMQRLGIEKEATEILPLDRFPPAPGQAAICIELRTGDTKAAAMIAPIDDRDTHLALDCERAFLAELDGSCRTPIAGHAVISGNSIDFSGSILTPDGSRALSISVSGNVTDAARIGTDAGKELRADAGPGFFESWT